MSCVGNNIEKETDKCGDKWPLRVLCRTLRSLTKKNTPAFVCTTPHKEVYPAHRQQQGCLRPLSAPVGTNTERVQSGHAQKSCKTITKHHEKSKATSILPCDSISLLKSKTVGILQMESTEKSWVEVCDSSPTVT